MSDFFVVIAGSAPISPFVGEFFRNGVRQDISGAVTIEFIITRADGTVVTRPGAFQTDGTDGTIEYRLVADDTAPGGTPVLGLYSVRIRVAGTAGGNPFDETTPDQYFHVREP